MGEGAFECNGGWPWESGRARGGWGMVAHALMLAGQFVVQCAKEYLCGLAMFFN